MRLPIVLLCLLPAWIAVAAEPADLPTFGLELTHHRFLIGPPLKEAHLPDPAFKLPDLPPIPDPRPAGEFVPNAKIMNPAAERQVMIIRNGGGGAIRMNDQGLLRTPPKPPPGG